METFFRIAVFMAHDKLHGCPVHATVGNLILLMSPSRYNIKLIEILSQDKNLCAKASVGIVSMTMIIFLCAVVFGEKKRINWTNVEFACRVNELYMKCI